MYTALKSPTNLAQDHLNHAMCQEHRCKNSNLNFRKGGQDWKHFVTWIPSSMSTASTQMDGGEASIQSVTARPNHPKLRFRLGGNDHGSSGRGRDAAVVKMIQVAWRKTSVSALAGVAGAATNKRNVGCGLWKAQPHTMLIREQTWAVGGELMSGVAPVAREAVPAPHMMNTFSICEKLNTSLVRGHATLSPSRMDTSEL